MHLLIPFAAPLSEAGRHGLGGLELPQLAQLLGTASTPERDEGDGSEQSPPHERALARAIGLEGADGLLPWAAHALADDGHDPGDAAWAQLIPVHCHVGTGQVQLVDPASLQLEQVESAGLLAAVRSLFEDEGFSVVYGAPWRWYISHESLLPLRTASIDRVVGRAIDPWLPQGNEARLWRRLQNEVQMLWHEHPINAARESRGLLSVNSIWLSGCGVAQRAQQLADLRFDDRLRGPALSEDWHAWQQAWQALDAGPIVELTAARDAGKAARLTLCGERSACSWSLARPSAWRRLTATWRPVDPRMLLETL